MKFYTEEISLLRGNRIQQGSRAAKSLEHLNLARSAASRLDEHGVDAAYRSLPC